MNVGFHSNQLGLRGTEVALYDYALFNETYLNNTSFILIPHSSEINTKVFNKFYAVFKDRLILYDNIDEVIRANKIDVCYYIKSGSKEGYISKESKSCIHSVFQIYQPHGDVYAYVSKWLANKMNHPLYVPHMVNLPEPTKNLRDKLGWSEKDRVIGRYGGYNEFDIPFVKEAISEIVEKHNDIKFVFMNTKPFFYHKNIVYIGSTSNTQNKSNFIATCDAMIHARTEGESFGLSIAEFLYHNKPVFAWIGGTDQNHHTMLDINMLYSNKEDLKNMLTSKLPQYDFRNLVLKDYMPHAVMDKFNEVFLK